MAELVDALVSNTNEETRAGSTPALGTKYFKSIKFHKIYLNFNDTKKTRKI